MSGWSSFLEVEPLTGRRHVEASERRTRQDWARWIRSMLTERYPQAERLEIHYTPKHGNWLNIAEIELSALGGQCLNRWMPDLATVRHQMRAWEQHRNNREVTVDWQFTTRDARIKLITLYPKI